MSKPERKQRPDEDVFYIEETDRQDIVQRMDEKGFNRRQLALACDVSASAITLLLKPIPKGETRGCRFMSKLQRVLGLKITAKRPTVQPLEDSRRAEQILKRLRERDPDELEHWLREGEFRASKRSN